MDSPDRAPSDHPTLEGVLNEVNASLDEGIPVGGPPNVDKIGENALLGVTAASMLPLRSAETEPSRNRLPDWLLLSTYVPSQERAQQPSRSWL